MNEKIERLKKMLEEETDEYRAMSIRSGIKKEQHFERFKSDILPTIPHHFKVSFCADNCKYTINNRKGCTVDYFPKSGRLLIRKCNGWVNNGLNLLKLFLNGKEIEKLF